MLPLSSSQTAATECSAAKTRLGESCAKVLWAQDSNGREVKVTLWLDRSKARPQASEEGLREIDEELEAANIAAGEESTRAVVAFWKAAAQRLPATAQYTPADVRVSSTQMLVHECRRDLRAQFCHTRCCAV